MAGTRAQVKIHVSEYYNSDSHLPGEKKSPSKYSPRVNRERKNEHAFTAVLKLLK